MRGEGESKGRWRAASGVECLVDLMQDMDGNGMGLENCGMSKRERSKDIRRKKEKKEW